MRTELRSKLFAMLLMALSLSLCACGGSESATDAKASVQTQPTATQFELPPAVGQSRSQ